jgi:Fe2+ or Zn2+ uptake regulation protein
MEKNEISFKQKWIGEDDEAIPITQLSARVPYKVWIALVKAGAVRKINFNGFYVYDINEEKAIPILKQFGYVIIQKEEKKVECDFEPVASLVKVAEDLGEVKE